MAHPRSPVCVHNALYLLSQSEVITLQHGLWHNSPGTFMIGPVASEISSHFEANFDGGTARSAFTYLALPPDRM